MTSAITTQNELDSNNTHGHLIGCDWISPEHGKTSVPNLRHALGLFAPNDTTIK